MTAWALFRRSSANFILRDFKSTSTWRFLVARRCHADSQTGLCGFRPLKTARGFQLFVDEAIERSNELVTYMKSMPSPAKIINAMDEISNTVFCVVDSAELCRNTNPDREFVHEANKASMRMNEYLHIIGYRSDSDFMVRQNMASSSRVVMSFLLDMREMVTDKAIQEFHAIRMFKSKRGGLSSADFEPWDEVYYTAMMKSSMLNLDSSVITVNCMPDVSLKPYGKKFVKMTRSLSLATGDALRTKFLQMEGLSTLWSKKQRA